MRKSHMLKILESLDLHTKKLERLEKKVIKMEERTNRIQIMLAVTGIFLAIIEIGSIILLLR
jgi:hypothetical protein